jgi:hypothetical protein
MECGRIIREPMKLDNPKKVKDNCNNSSFIIHKLLMMPYKLQNFCNDE